MRIDFFGKTDKGQVRRTNEDFFAGEKVKEREYLFVVADGMGGHRAGDVASRLGTVCFVKHYKKLRKKKNSIIDSIDRSLIKANLAILEKATSDPRKRGMGTTFSAMVISDMKAYIAHVGDSRIYLIREDKIYQLTTDHTFVGKMVEEGRITEDEARDHPQKNILYMSLGARKTFEPEINKNFDIQEGDTFIMCSDGLNNMVEDRTIKEYVLSYSTRESVEELVKLANTNGGTDNITLQVIHVNKSREPEKTEPIPIVKEKGKPFGFIKKFFKKWTASTPYRSRS
ncbi:MAG: Stp1/IreP family PP2C-type Ser/Thr phosphatase [Candidatus Aminicenantes bacterium]|nr:Stp1/IreP family PP2C-type Ser/Thr phosphatase [Candidatus Aminicenantes bacterium]NIM80955.1 Stp1/IreP family PP2C-type Ser/Thr phosphatase [Candidatus Aminicenantes bacterium]NIN20337.1 Stp1/IreP family PP2C-type Ser/Thr phosphatase [Candidatus Aminicenantes bacterium]NIN44112.1 Stp1/IreP family PP2C-type Ser/Thr phosphatase [Candidatus Aminicenantes bacterium]NIN86925.1 Stp1/IreP family PP2C-type Ser/Thr phosphatase [Candidatus Aminicenantes bacterium]